MPAPFALLQDRVNRAVVDRLSNAIAVVNGVDVPVEFDRPYVGAFGGQADASAPECMGPVEHLGGFGRGDSIVIDGSTYEVLTAEPDGAGFVRLVLGSR